MRLAKQMKKSGLCLDCQFTRFVMAGTSMKSLGDETRVFGGSCSS